MDKEYLELFKNTEDDLKGPKDFQLEKSNEYYNQFENLGSNNNQYQQYENVGANNFNFDIQTNVNDGWGTNQYQTQVRNNHFKQKNEKHGLNGLDQYLDEDPRQKRIQQRNQQHTIDLTPPVVDDVKDVDDVTIDMFENMNTASMIKLVRGSNVQNVNLNEIKHFGNGESTIRYINS